MPDKLIEHKAALPLEQELDSLLSVARESHDWARTLQDLLDLAIDANGCFDYEKALHYLTLAEEIWDSKNLPGFSIELRFNLHREKGSSFSSLGKHEEAIAEYQKILRFCRDSSHLSMKSEMFAQIGQLLAKKGDHDRALGYLQRAIGSYRRLGDKIGLCKALRNLGVVYVELGEFHEAETHYDEAIRVAINLEDKLVYADLVNNFGTVKNMQGDWEEALSLYRESLEIYEARREIRKSGYTKNNIAITMAEQGMNEKAFDYFLQADEIAREVKDLSLALIVDINLADLYLKKNSLAKARHHCEKALQFLTDNDLKNGNMVEAIKIEGKVAFAEKDYDKALTCFTESLELSQVIGAQFLEAEVLLERGTLFRAMEQHLEALSDLEASYHIYRTLKAESKREQTEKIIGSIERLYLDIFQSMAAKVDLKDKYTKGHSDRVAALALILCRNLGMNTSLLKTIVAAALLHDIGKIKIDDAILNKEGKLTDEEYREIQRHPELGVELLRAKWFPWDIKPLILGHHEKMNGKGYPHGLKGEDIPLGARIICIVDVFDALTSDRIYRDAFSVPKALEIMEDESGTSFDPVILRCLTELVKDGKADFIINSRTDDDEIISIWAKCMIEVELVDTVTPWTELVG